MIQSDHHESYIPAICRWLEWLERPAPSIHASPAKPYDPPVVT
jgi:hypothetical protein